MSATLNNEHYKYCLSKGLKIYPVVKSSSLYTITVEQVTNGIKSLTEYKEEYSISPSKKAPKWHEKIYELYTEYYNLLKKAEDEKADKRRRKTS